MKKVATSYLLSTQSIVAAGSVIGDATQITTKPFALILGTAANGTKGIKLPKAVAGKMYLIKNDDGANAILKVWPFDANTAINAVTAGAALSMAAKTGAVFVALSTTQWYTFPLLPS